MTPPPRVYLAGPDVFHPDRDRLFRVRARLCRAYGLEPLIPFDLGATTASAIYCANLRLLDTSDAVVANFSPFRGPHADVGTAWEVGYAVARGTPVWAFSDVQGPLTARISTREAPAGVDALGLAVEDFGLADNLMLVEGLADRAVHSSFEAAIARVAARLLGEP
jgi:nucleoside 2-deoxyribosyltransferase